MKNKLLISVVLSVVLMFSFSTVAFANGDTFPMLNDQTVITDDNIYEVLDFLGLDTNVEIEEDYTTDHVIITIGEFREMIEKTKNQDMHIGTSTVVPSTIRAIGYKTISRPHERSGYTIYAEITGKYYKDSAIKYWTEVSGIELKITETMPSNMRVRFDGAPSKGVCVLDAGTSSSRLNYTFKATVIISYKVSNVWVPTLTQDTEALNCNIYTSEI